MWFFLAIRPAKLDLNIIEGKQERIPEFMLVTYFQYIEYVQTINLISRLVFLYAKERR